MILSDFGSWVSPCRVIPPSMPSQTGRQWCYGLGGAVTWPRWGRGEQGDAACICGFFPRRKPYSLSHLWTLFTDFPGLPSGVSGTVLFPEQSETPVFPLGHPWLSAYLSVDFFPLSPSISSLIPLDLTASQIIAVSSLCASLSVRYMMVYFHTVILCKSDRDWGSSFASFYFSAFTVTPAAALMCGTQ